MDGDPDVFKQMSHMTICIVLRNWPTWRMCEIRANPKLILAIPKMEMLPCLTVYTINWLIWVNHVEFQHNIFGKEGFYILMARQYLFAYFDKFNEI